MLLTESALFIGVGLVDVSLYNRARALAALFYVVSGILNAFASRDLRHLAASAGQARRGQERSDAGDPSTGSIVWASAGRLLVVFNSGNAQPPPSEGGQSEVNIGRRHGGKPWEQITVVVGQASAVPLLFVPLWTEWNSGVHDLTDIAISAVAAALLIIAIGLTMAAIWSRPQLSFGRGWVAIVALLPLASSLQFWYLTFYKPVHERPNVNVVAQIDGIESRGGTSRMMATITLDNNGSTDLIFFDATYALTRHELAATERQMTGDEFYYALQRSKLTKKASFPRYMGLLETGRVIYPGGHLARGQKVLTTRVFDVKEPVAGSKLRLTVFLSTVVGNGRDLELEDCQSDVAHPSTCRETPLPGDGWLQGILGDHLMARISFHNPRNFPPYLETRFQFSDAESSDGQFLLSQQVRDFYPYLNTRGFTTTVEYVSSP